MKVRFPDKAKPPERARRKAAGLISKKKMAELPKDKPLVSSAFLSTEYL